MPIRNSLLRALYYTSEEELFYDEYSTFYTRLSKTYAKTLFGSEDFSSILTCDSWGKALSFAYSSLMFIPESIALVLTECTYSLNLYLNDCIISNALTESPARIENLVALTILKIFAMTAHALTCLLSFYIHCLTRLPEINHCVDGIIQISHDLNEPRLKYKYPIYNAWRHVSNSLSRREQEQINFYQSLIEDPVGTIDEELATLNQRI
jgi:hypothetical protein